MRLNAPKHLTFIISVLLIVLGLLGSLIAIPIVSPYSFWFTFAGGALLTLGCLLKGL